MISRSLDLDGDWTFGKGRSNYLKNNDAIRQNLSTRLKCFLGDCYFDTAAGIDWWRLLGGKSEVSILLSVRTLILNTDGITGLLELSADLDDNRNLSISCKVTTIYSLDTGLSVTVGVP